jgi:hypothetical protein
MIMTKIQEVDAVIDAVQDLFRLREHPRSGALVSIAGQLVQTGLAMKACLDESFITPNPDDPQPSPPPVADPDHYNDITLTAVTAIATLGHGLDPATPAWQYWGDLTSMVDTFAAGLAVRETPS